MVEGQKSVRAAEPLAHRDSSTERCVTRRGLLRGVAMAGALAGAHARATPPAYSAEVDPGALLSKLIRRVTMGTNRAEVERAAALGYEGYLEFQLNPDAVPDSALNARLAGYPTLTMTYEQMLNVPSAQTANECVEATVLRHVLSERQLFERMVEFWSDHFSIDMGSDGRSQRLKAIDDRDVIRPHAMGNFPELLFASARSPAMLAYLNNELSAAGNPNENYARELLELHTLGVNGGYTQQDVAEVARCFTGWTVWSELAGPDSGTFRYRPEHHDTGPKTVLGVTIPARPAPEGTQDGIDVLILLAAHPSTAAHIAFKLCRWLLGHNTPQGVVSRVAAVYTATGGDIRSMIRECLRPNHLAAASPKHKRPWHLYMSMLRAAPCSILGTAGLRYWILRTGHPLFRWPTPDGYPDQVEYWAGGVLERWTFAAELMRDTVTGVSVDASAFFAGTTTADQAATRVNEWIFGGEMTPDEYTRLRNYLYPNPPMQVLLREGLGLVFSFPTFQMY